jgi:hypothetical protein
VRFLFHPPAESAAELLTLPWHLPLEDWVDPRMVEVPTGGLHRHVVRFVEVSGDVYALKELSERLARREYDILGFLGALELPAVRVLGVAVDRPDLDAILVTEFLPFSTTYRSLFATPRGGYPTERLLDALVQLLARLHLAGVFWGDCSLSNTLFRLDAGALAAYLVDAETSERQPTLTEGLRRHDIDLAHDLVAGELMDLEAAELLPPDLDPVEFADELVRRYDGLWHELTAEEIVPPAEQRHRIGQRVRRLNELGFDVDELELVETPDGNVLKVRTRVAEPGHARRELLALTGLAAEENQARRLLNDIAGYRAHLERKTGGPVSKALAASRWLTDVYAKVVDAVPPALRDRLSPAELFHEVLEHRWYRSEAEGRDVGTTEAARSYFSKVLPDVPAEFTAAPPQRSTD